MDKTETCSSTIKTNQLRSKTDSELFSFNENKGLEVVLNNKEIFNSKINEAKKNIESKNFEMASRGAFEAASFAVSNHPGMFTSQELEMLLIECGNHFPKVTLTLKLPEKKEKRWIFHVMSEGAFVGGHTRLVKNWIELDTESIHFLITTWQIKSMPNWVVDAVAKSGGTCIPLDAVSESFLARAAVLREITNMYADIIVCHMHMHDPIPVMAFGIEGGPPVIYLNHGDHLFWLGSSIADIVLDLRPAAQKLTLSRRNINASIILPIPLSTPKNAMSKATARCVLGIPQDAVVILSIANKEKYDSFSSYDFIDFLKILLQENENAVAILVGPTDKGKFYKANLDTNGRIKAVGVQGEIDKYYCSADIYLDSYMFSSLTSALNAGLKGMPIAALKNINNETLSFDDIAFEGLNNQFTSMDEYIGYVDRLIKDKDFRNSEGKCMLDSITKYHIDLWKTYLDKGYASVENKRHKLNTEDIKEVLGVEDLFLALYQKQNKT